jgi:hypothetical protein
MSRALLLVPPFLKHATGPLLGPAMLAGAAIQAGHSAEVIDLNARWICNDLGNARWVHGDFVGDHDRCDALMVPSQRRALAELERCAARAAITVNADALKRLRLDHASIDRISSRFAREQAPWMGRQLARCRRPDVVGVSVMYAGQVVWALALTRFVRDHWPGVPVIWGGAHVTALAAEIAGDARYGTAADGFVAGYAESTFVSLLDAIGRGTAWPEACFAAGSGRHPRAEGDDGHTLPSFQDIHLPLGARLTLPAQRSRGCAYGRCEFCTYPAIEGASRTLSLDSVRAVLTEALRRGAAISFKDSLMTRPLLREVAQIIAGRVRWSACTKLTLALDAAMLRELARGGCRTLEIGLETLDEKAQHLIEKRQSYTLFQRTLDAAAGTGIALVVNYMTGFPGVSEADERGWLDAVHRELQARPTLRAKVEHNHFELERLAPIARSRPRGLQVIAAWPWSSVLDWCWEAPGAPRCLPVVA